MSGQHTHADGIVSNPFIEINQKLKGLGIDNSVTLPQICVVGDQSSGKSSLVESISAIRVPKDADCCTRCPLQINLLSTSATEWKCDVSLVENYRYDNNPRLRKPCRDRPLGPWCKLETTKTTLFTSTHDQDGVCSLIQRAQLAILNPSVDPTSYLGGTRLQKKLEVDFSPNVIRIEISGSASPNLSFVDLPGIIENTADRANDYLIDLVKALVAEYVAQTHSINLLTLPMTTDIATSSSMRIIQRHDAEPRTIIVMTKPDMVHHDGHRKQFLNLLKNTETRMASHMVRMQQDASIPLADARIMELDYFKTSTWVPQLEAFISKLGIPNLVNHLRSVLQRKTRDCLPAIEASIQQRLKAIGTQLDALPEPPDLQVLPSILFGLVQDFGERMKKLFLGGGNVDQYLLLNDWEGLAQSFHQAITNAWPRLTISTEVDKTRMRKARATIARNTERSKTPKGHQSEAAHEISNDDDDDDSTIGTKSETTPLRSVRQHQLHAAFTLTRIRNINSKHATPGLPRQIFPMAIKEMQILCVADWDQPLGDFILRMSQMMSKEVERHVRCVFRDYQHLPIVEVSSRIVFDAFSKIFNEQKTILDMLLAVEQEKPYTRDGTALERETKKNLKSIVPRRQAYRVELEQAVRDAAKSSDVKSRNKDKVTEADLEEDEWSTEIEMLAKVRSYYYIASTRFVDNICQSISARLFTRYARELAAHLREELGPMDPKKHGLIAELMTEDPERLRLRKLLLEEKEKLLEAQKLVDEVVSNNENEVRATPPTMPVTPLEKARSAGKRANADSMMEVDGPNKEPELDETPLTKRARTELANTILNGDRGSEDSVELD